MEGEKRKMWELQLKGGLFNHFIPMNRGATSSGGVFAEASTSGGCSSSLDSNPNVSGSSKETLDQAGLKHNDKNCVVNQIIANVPGMFKLCGQGKNQKIKLTQHQEAAIMMANILGAQPNQEATTYELHDMIVNYIKEEFDLSVEGSESEDKNEDSQLEPNTVQAEEEGQGEDEEGQVDHEIVENESHEVDPDAEQDEEVQEGRNEDEEDEPRRSKRQKKATQRYITQF